MGDKADGLAGPLPQGQKLFVQIIAYDLIQRPERLIHQQDVGIERQGARDAGALLHAAGKLPGIFAPEPVQLDQRQHVSNPLRLFRPGKPHDLQRKFHISRNRPPRIQPRRLKDIAVGPRLPRRLGAHAIDAQAARSRAFQRRDGAQQGGLATTRRADEADKLALADGQVDVLQRLHRAVGGVKDQGQILGFDHRICGRKRVFHPSATPPSPEYPSAPPALVPSSLSMPTTPG